ncbi:MAG: VWA domain-containing protein [Saprospiraceae bacterium]|nr:VWA domain-containing protein [Saprospiraceae bacterium]
MKSISTLAKLAFLFLLVAAAGCNKDDDALPTDLSRFFRMKTFEVGVVPSERMVQVLFQVTDYEGKGVSSLQKEDFIVTENKGKIDSEADLRVGISSIPFELKTVLLLDLTRSVEGMVPQIKAAARSLVEMKLPEQQIAIFTFDADTHEVQPFSKNKAELLAAIDALPETGLVNSTNLYGAVIDVANLWEDNYSIDGIVDGSLVVFTDGRHNASQTITLPDALDALGNRRAYVAALASPDLDEAALNNLAKVPERYFKAEDTAGLEKMFTDIQAEIQSLSNSIYFLYYQSPISDPTPFQNELTIGIKDNVNNGSDGKLFEYFNSEGFGN